MNTLEVKIWLLKKGIKQVDIAKELGISKATVCKVVNGKDKSSRVVNWLRQHGCPESYLSSRK